MRLQTTYEELKQNQFDFTINTDAVYRLPMRN